MRIAPTTGEAPVIDDGVYDLLIHTVKPFDLPEPDEWGKTQKLEINVEVLGIKDEEGSAIFLDPRPNRSLSSGGKSGNASTLYRICVAAGLDVSAGFDTEELEGKKLRGVIKTEEGKWPRITDWMKATGKAPVRAVETQQPSQDAEAEELSDWWKTVRDMGMKPSVVLDKSLAMFKAPPADISGEQRAELYLALLEA